MIFKHTHCKLKQSISSPGQATLLLANLPRRGKISIARGTAPGTMHTINRAADGFIQRSEHIRRAG
jgi:hypothetical protein